MYVIGTAGHVDHGKSTLVKALTGIEPDRLREEQERQLTIDLGFAWLTLDGIDEEVGVVDVPGHRDFIENMLAGVGGIDLALLVIAADEGVMPQTREHLAILDLLQVRAGVIAITKTDLVADEEWLELVMLDVADTVADTVLADAPLMPVSARTGAGLDDLRAALAEALTTTAGRESTGRARLPIDRAFSVSGFGTVVTGTLLDGRLQVGDEVEVQPSGLTGRVRGLQTHQTKKEVARPGSRVAVNVSGMEVEQVSRGRVLTVPGAVRPTILVDADYRHLPGAEKPLAHNAEVKLFVGSAEVVARTRVLAAESIAPGETGWVQFALRDPVAVLRGDRFIVRRPSPPATLGGGRVLDPHPGRKHRRFRPQVAARLRTLASGTPGERLAQKLRTMQPVSTADFRRAVGVTAEAFETAVDEMVTAGLAERVGEQWVTAGWVADRETQAVAAVAAYQRAHRLRPGMPRAELQRRLGADAALLARVVAGAGLVADGPVVRTAEHEMVLTAAEEAAAQELLATCTAADIDAPTVKEAQAAVGEPLLRALADMGRIVIVNDEIVYAPAVYARVRQTVIDHVREAGAATAASVRDLLGTSRKYAIALLEQLDREAVTRRVGDERRLR